MTLPTPTRALVTGGGSGLGRALALELGRRGAQVLVADIRLAAAEETVSELSRSGSTAAAVACDVAQADEVERAFQRADSSLGGLDLVVNNAGVAVAGTVGEVPIKDWEWIVGINLMGVVHGCHCAMQRFRPARRGAILNVASAAGLISSPNMAPYNATKAAVVALSETLHQEARELGISVSVLCPTFFRTGIIAGARKHGDQRLTQMADKLMDRSKLQADDVARAAIDGVDRGELYVVPMADGRWMWRAQRAAPGLFYGSLAPKLQGWLLKRISR